MEFVYFPHAQAIAVPQPSNRQRLSPAKLYCIDMYSPLTGESVTFSHETGLLHNLRTKISYDNRSIDLAIRNILSAFGYINEAN